MRRTLVRILMVSLLFAQSAWAFEGHTGHFEAAASTEPAGESLGPDGSQEGHSGQHCAHSPIHFVAVHRHVPAAAPRPEGGALPTYRAPLAVGHAQPPTPPPRG